MLPAGAHWLPPARGAPAGQGSEDKADLLRSDSLGGGSSKIMSSTQSSVNKATVLDSLVDDL